MKPFKKINFEFNYTKLRKDVTTVVKQIKEEAIGSEFEGLASRNICLTIPEENSDKWHHGIAGKSFLNNTQQRYDLHTQFDKNSNEMIDESIYVNPIKQIQGTYLEELVQSFKGIYRWRISILPPRTTLSIHVDGSPYMQTLNQSGAILDWRLHLPITTNNRCFLVNWPDSFGTPKEDGEDINLQMAHFKAGSSYLLNTSKTHCATNYSENERIHLIASLSNQTAKNLSK